MWRRDGLTRRVALGIGLFAAFLMPWPGLDAPYGACVRAVGNAVFGRRVSQLGLSFTAIPREARRPLDTRITLVNLRETLPDGRLRSGLLDLDTRGVGWVPTAFLAALVLATPIPWGRRLRALLCGECLMQGFVALSIAVHILKYSEVAGGVGVIAIGEPWRSVVDGLDETLVVQMGAGFLAAACIWVVSTMRRSDWATALRPMRRVDLAPARACYGKVTMR
jgi:hypothetical protein